jgi:hypothetical protein
MVPFSLRGQGQGSGDLEARIARVISEYERQGFHRTGSDVDRRSGDWLYEQARRIGSAPARESFELNRIDPEACHLAIETRRVDGLPLFDGTFTDGLGVRGRLGPIDSDAEIGLVEAPPNTAAAGALGDARREHRHRGLVCVTRGGRPGLCPSNADSFLRPYGPPVLQISSEHSSFLSELAQRRPQVTLLAAVRRRTARAFNVTARIAGQSPALAPLVVMTPRSGWYSCASERGGGIACWLELMRMFISRQPTRDVVFVASSGHELGHLGINVFVEQRPAIVANSIGWFHLGANIGAAIPAGSTTQLAETAERRHATPVASPGTTIQASDDEFEALLAGAMTAADLRIGRRNPRGTVPGGEAEVVHRGGGRYVSVIGSNALFHNPEDRGPQVVNVGEVARFVRALAAVAEELSYTPRDQRLKRGSGLSQEGSDGWSELASGLGRWSARGRRHERQRGGVAWRHAW